MRLTSALAKQAGARLRIERSSPGAGFILELPLNTNEAKATG